MATTFKQSVQKTGAPGKNFVVTTTYTFTATDTTPPYVDLRGAVALKVLVDGSQVSALSTSLEESLDGVNSGGTLLAAFTTAAPKQIAGPFGFVRPPSTITLTGTSYTVTFLALYQ